MQLRVYLVSLGLGAWILTVGAGFWSLLRYEGTPNPAGAPVPSWPAESRLERDTERANLVMVVHPHCPCSRASISSLAKIMTRCQGLVTARVLFYKPAELPPGWERTDLWRSAAEIPGVEVLCDEGGALARHFGAATSGQVLLYSPAGLLLFRGGITPSRGHEGESLGQDAVIALVTEGKAKQASSPVFGCPLEDLEDATPER